MKNRYHILEPNDKLIIQNNFLFFDTETKKTIKQKKEIHTLKLGWVIHWDKKQDKTESKYFQDVKTFWDYVEEKTKKQLIIFAHNTDFDFKVTKGYEEMMIKRGWTIKKIYIQGTVFIMKITKDKKTIMILDTMNYVSTSLKNIGESLNHPKMDIDFDNCTRYELSRYCYNDTEIIYKFIRKLIQFIEENKLTRLMPTAGSLAFNAFRHRFYQHKEKPIHIHANQKAIELERRSYRGGITDCLKIGKYKDRLYKLDVNSMYPYIMKKYKMPVKLLFYSHNTEKYDLKKIMKKRIKQYHIIADCIITIPEKYAYILTRQKIGTEKKSIFIKGKHNATLTTPEIEYILKYGKIYKVTAMAMYQKDDIFSEYINFFYNKRIEYKKKNNKSFEKICKLMLNSLYGKFGQKGTDNKILADNAPPSIAQYTIIKGMKKYNVLKIGSTIIQYIKNDKNAFNSLVAISSMVTSYSRMYLVEMILKAGRKNVYYLDTDCLIVNEEGKNNLKRYIDETGKKELGMLELESSSIKSEFIKPKYYFFSEELKCKGVRKTAEKLKEDKNELIIVQDQFERYKTSFKNKNTGKQVIKPIIKHISKKYDKGHVKKGIVSPYSKNDILKYSKEHIVKW